MNIGILTGGGDCPGLNAVIRAAVVRGKKTYGDSMFGIRDGWRGLVDDDIFPLGYSEVAGILSRGGTILGTSRTNPKGDAELLGRIEETVRRRRLDAVIAVGGDDTLSVALELRGKGTNTVGVPKTIDNDVSGTDYTFGFQTAVSIATDAIDRLRTTADSHHRILVVEVMGRHAGWIAYESGMASGADLVLVPEFHYEMDRVCEIMRSCHGRKGHGVLVVAEGAKEKGRDLVVQHEKRDAFGHVMLGGIAHGLAARIEEETGIPARATVLGYLQRGGEPVAYDRVLGTRFGLAAVDAVHGGDFGQMVALRGGRIGRTPLEDAVRENRVLPETQYGKLEVFFG